MLEDTNQEDTPSEANNAKEMTSNKRVESIIAPELMLLICVTVIWQLVSLSSHLPRMIIYGRQKHLEIRHSKLLAG